MRTTVRLKLLVSVVAILLCPVWSRAQDVRQDTSDAGGALQGGAQQPKGTHLSVEACWDAWKAREKLDDGKNERNGYYILVSHQKSGVSEDPGSKNWLAGRNQAFNYAEITARAAMAQGLRSTIQSSRQAAIRTFGGDSAPQNLRPIVDQLSIADKSRVLVDKALDDEIKKYDPKWDGKGGDKARRDAVTTLQMKIDNNIARDAEVFASGAFTTVQCEGPSAEAKGQYSVLVGLIWSPKLAWVAETLWNPTLTAMTEPARAPLREQFEALRAENPDWLAYTNGVRVFTDEKGERVVVGFGVAPQSTLVPADKSRASLGAMGAIQRFVGEKIVAHDDLAEDYEHRTFATGEVATYDASTFNQKITARAKTLQLRGAVEVASWRGEHPWSKAGMQVVAVAWTRRWESDADAVGKALSSVERRREQQGGVPSVTNPEKAATAGTPSAAPVRSGAGVSASDF